MFNWFKKDKEEVVTPAVVEVLPVLSASEMNELAQKVWDQKKNTIGWEEAQTQAQTLFDTVVYPAIKKAGENGEFNVAIDLTPKDCTRKALYEMLSNLGYEAETLTYTKRVYVSWEKE